MFFFSFFFTMFNLFCNIFFSIEHLSLNLFLFLREKNSAIFYRKLFLRYEDVLSFTDMLISEIVAKIINYYVLNVNQLHRN